MVSENLKIEIRPVPNRGEIRKFSKNLEYYSQAHIITPFVNPVTLKFETGLTEEDIKYLKDKGFPYELSNNFKHGEPHPFWESNLVKVELRNTPMFLYPGKSLIDFVKYKYLLVNNFVYSSESQMKEGTKPQATHYIYNEEEEVEVKATILEQRNRLIREVAELSLDKKRQYVLILNNENTDNKNDSYLTVKLEEIINSPKRSELEELIDKKKEEVDALAVIKSAVRKNVIKKTRKGYFYYDVLMGLTEGDVVQYLSKPENQEELLTIKTKIQ